MDPDTPRSVPDRAVALLLYAPVGAALATRDALAGAVGRAADRGAAEITARRLRLHERIVFARGMGQFTVHVAFPKLRDHLAGRLRDTAGDTCGAIGRLVRGPAEERAVPTAATAPGGVRRGPAPAPPRTNGDSVPAVDAPAASSLPIPGYNELSASQVVERLEGLTPAELDRVRAYEGARRSRRTILGKIDQLSR
ncbi:MAG: hypothetical protein M5U14_06045 [Acidimicrobiia bacterium]|nr:hypothetical protein [Acidimicrobiia bacterium]